MSTCEETYTFIKNKWEWPWYKKRIDLNEKMEHTHDGDPDKFPCLVNSWIGRNNRVADDCRHSFVYQEEKKCSECGSKSIGWPMIAEISNPKEMETALAEQKRFSH